MVANPPLTDGLGWSAAGLTLLDYSCNSDRVRLRCIAQSASAAFIAHGLKGPLWPVLAPHFKRAPIAAWRLWHTLLLQRERQAQVTAVASP